jgi:hypothetical protein
MIIGHTHGPRIVPYDSGQDFFALVDAGGWLEDCRDSGGEVGMLTAFCADQIKLFQLAPL